MRDGKRWNNIHMGKKCNMNVHPRAGNSVAFLVGEAVSDFQVEVRYEHICRERTRRQEEEREEKYKIADN